MDTAYPTSAYDLLTDVERKAVEDYLNFALAEQKKRNQRVDLIKNLPIPSEYVKRSRGALLKPIVRAALSERIDEVSANEDISPDRVVRELAKIAFSDVTDYIYSGSYGDVNLRPLREIPSGKSGAIKSVETKVGVNGVNSKIIMHDKLPALKMLSELMGMTAPDTPPVLAEYVKQEIRKTANEQIEAADAEYTVLLEHIAER